MNPLPWKLTAAYNFGFFEAGGLNNTFVLKVDCDTFISQRFFEANDLRTHAITRIAGDEGFLQASHWKARDENDRHINGVFVAHSMHVKSVNGYDERFETYGYDDTDLYIRLARLPDSMRLGNITLEDSGKRWGYIEREIEGESLIQHIWHPTASSAVYPPVCPNRLGLMKLIVVGQTWDRQNRTTYEKQVSSAREYEELGKGLTYAEYKVTSWVPNIEHVLGPSKSEEVLKECSSMVLGLPSV